MILEKSPLSNYLIQIFENSECDITQLNNASKIIEKYNIHTDPSPVNNTGANICMLNNSKLVLDTHDQIRRCLERLFIERIASIIDEFISITGDLRDQLINQYSTIGIVLRMQQLAGADLSNSNYIDENTPEWILWDKLDNNEEADLNFDEAISQLSLKNIPLILSQDWKSQHNKYENLMLVFCYPDTQLYCATMAQDIGTVLPTNQYIIVVDFTLGVIIYPDRSNYNSTWRKWNNWSGLLAYTNMIDFRIPQIYDAIHKLTRAHYLRRFGQIVVRANQFQQ